MFYSGRNESALPGTRSSPRGNTESIAGAGVTTAALDEAPPHLDSSAFHYLTANSSVLAAQARTTSVGGAQPSLSQNSPPQHLRITNTNNGPNQRQLPEGSRETHGTTFPLHDNPMFESYLFRLWNTWQQDPATDAPSPFTSAMDHIRKKQKPNSRLDVNDLIMMDVRKIKPHSIPRYLTFRGTEDNKRKFIAYRMQAIALGFSDAYPPAQTWYEPDVFANNKNALPHATGVTPFGLFFFCQTGPSPRKRDFTTTTGRCSSHILRTWFLDRVKTTKKHIAHSDHPNEPWIDSFGQSDSEISRAIDEDFDMTEGKWKLRRGGYGTGILPGKRKLHSLVQSPRMESIPNVTPGDNDRFTRLALIYHTRAKFLNDMNTGRSCARKNLYSALWYYVDWKTYTPNLPECASRMFSATTRDAPEGNTMELGGALHVPKTRLLGRNQRTNDDRDSDEIYNDQMFRASRKAHDWLMIDVAWPRRIRYEQSTFETGSQRDERPQYYQDRASLHMYDLVDTMVPEFFRDIGGVRTSYLGSCDQSLRIYHLLAATLWVLFRITEGKEPTSEWERFLVRDVTPYAPKRGEKKYSVMYGIQQQTASSDITSCPSNNTQSQVQSQSAHATTDTQQNDTPIPFRKPGRRRKNDAPSDYTNLFKARTEISAAELAYRESANSDSEDDDEQIHHTASITATQGREIQGI